MTRLHLRDNTVFPHSAMPATDIIPLTEEQVRKGLRINVIAGSLGMAWAAVSQGVALTMFMEALGATGVQIGLVVTAQQLAMLAQIPFALYAETLPRRKRWWACASIPHRALWLVPAVLPFLMPGLGAPLIWTILGVITLSSVLAHAGVPVWFSWMTELVPARISGRFWGARQSLLMGSFLLATILAGWALDQFTGDPDGHASFLGFALVFGVAGLLGIADIVVHLWVPEPPGYQAATRPALWPRLLAPLKIKDFRRLTFVMGGWTFAIGVCGSFSMVYLKREFEVDYIHLAALAVGGSAGGILAGLTLGKLIDRIGARTVGMLCLTFGPLFSVSWFFVSSTPVAIPLPFGGPWILPQPILLIFLTNVLAGSLYSGVGLCQLSLMGSLAPSEGRTMAMAVHWTLIGAIASLGPVVGGLIVDLVSAHPIPGHLPTGEPINFFHVLVLLHMLAAWLCVPMLRKVQVREGELSMADAMARIRLGNPLRAVSVVNGMLGSLARRPRAKR